MEDWSGCGWIGGGGRGRGVEGRAMCEFCRGTQTLMLGSNSRTLNKREGMEMRIAGWVCRIKKGALFCMFHIAKYTASEIRYWSYIRIAGRK